MRSEGVPAYNLADSHEEESRVSPISGYLTSSFPSEHSYDANGLAGDELLALGRCKFTSLYSYAAPFGAYST